MFGIDLSRLIGKRIEQVVIDDYDPVEGYTRAKLENETWLHFRFKYTKIESAASAGLLPGDTIAEIKELEGTLRLRMKSDTCIEISITGRDELQPDDIVFEITGLDECIYSWSTSD